jgi:hypothetical protein
MVANYIKTNHGHITMLTWKLYRIFKLVFNMRIYLRNCLVTGWSKLGRGSRHLFYPGKINSSREHSNFCHLLLIPNLSGSLFVTSSTITWSTSVVEHFDVVEWKGRMCIFATFQETQKTVYLIVYYLTLILHKLFVFCK